MNKEKLIEALKDLLYTMPNTAGENYNEGVRDAIDLIKQWQDEPITAEALEAAGWNVNLDRPTREFFKIPLDSAEGFPRLLTVLRNDNEWSALANHGGERVWFSLKHMAHLRALEEMFLQ